LDILQEIFLAWQGALGLDLKRVAINAEVVSSGEAASSDGVMSFFSGGVDGTFTAARNHSRITTGVLLRGIDMQLENESLWDAASQAATRLSAHFGFPLLRVETNIRFLGYHYGLKWARH